MSDICEVIALIINNVGISRMIGEKKKSFFKEFLDSWVGGLSRWVLVVLIIACGLLYFEFFPFNSLSSHLSEDKYGYTFKMMEIAVSILAFAALVWSISYQRDELLQSREELKIQSEDVNRSIDEANKNFDRELLLEFYRKITDEIQGVDFGMSSFLVNAQPRIFRDNDKKIVKEIQDCIGRAGFSTLEFQALFKRIEEKAKSIEASDSDLRELYQYAFSDSHIKSAIRIVEERLSRVEVSVLILLYDMILYAKNKEVSFEEPVFSLLKSGLKKSDFFVGSEYREYRLNEYSFLEACTDLGLTSVIFNDEGAPLEREFKKDIYEFIDALHSLGFIYDKEEFWEMLPFSAVI